MINSGFVVTGPLRTLWLLYCTIFSGTCFDLSRIVVNQWLNTKMLKNRNIKKVKVKSCWLSISSISPSLLPSGWPATSSSASHCDPALLLPLLHLKTIGGHHPHNWCLVKFRFRIHNNISLAWSNPNCLVDLPFEAAVETSSHNHWEDLLLTTMYQLAMLPEWRLFSLIPHSSLMLQPSGVGKNIPMQSAALRVDLRKCCFPTPHALDQSSVKTIAPSQQCIPVREGFKNPRHRNFPLTGVNFFP